MAHELTRLRSKMFDTPLLIDPRTFESVMNYLDKRCEGGAVLETKEDSLEFSMYDTLYYEENNLGVISINGPLTNKSTGWEALCGGTSYESIKEDFESLVVEGAKTIAFMVESGGGEAYGMMDTGNYLRKLADENGVRIISYVDGLSASAAYGLTAISDEIVSNKQSEIGSVGVLIRLMNDSKALEQKGYERTFVTAGSEKIPFAEDGSFRKEFIQDLQDKVDALYKDFTEYVAEHRGMSVEAVRNTEAKTFLSEEAVALGLADKIMTLEDFYSYLSSEAQSNKTGKEMNNRIFKFMKNEVTPNMSVDMPKLEELQTQLSDYQAQVTTLQASLEDMTQLKASLEAALGEKETALADAQALVAQLEQEKVEQKLQARKDKLAAVTSADQVEALAASLSSLDDAAFSTVVGAMAAQAKAVENSEMFTEVGDQGVEASVEDVAAPKTSTTDALIQARLQNR